MRLVRLHPPLMLTAAVMAVLTAISAAGLLLDDRMLVGVPIWVKPLKFSISILVYTATLAWLISLLKRRRRLAWWLGAVIGVAILLEMAAIVLQAARGRQSHFNVATPLDTALFGAMGITIVVVWLASAAVGVMLLLERIADRPAAVAIRLGLLIALGAMAIGFLMTQPTADQLTAMEDTPPTIVGAHSVGVPDGGPGLPLVNWSTTGGDLRVAHFLGMHALQALPLLAFGLTLAARRSRRLRGDRTRTRLVAVAGAAYGAVVVLTVWQALRGQPLIHPDALTLGVLAAIAAAAAVGTAWALAAPDDVAPTDTVSDTTADHTSQTPAVAR